MRIAATLTAASIRFASTVSKQSLRPPSTQHWHRTRCSIDALLWISEPLELADLQVTVQARSSHQKSLRDAPSTLTPAAARNNFPKLLLRDPPDMKSH
jgi:hypothetical protein